MGGSPVVIVTGRRRPHEVMLLAVSVLLGIAYLVGTPQPNSLNEALPTWVFYGWAAMHLVAGLTGLAGCYWPRRRDVGMEIERVAMLLQASAIVVYVGAVFALNGVQAVAAGLVWAFWAGANVWRAGQLTSDLRAIERGSS